MEYTNLHAASLTTEAHERTCGYWYTVTSGAMAHTAFATRHGLDRWMRERGLSLERELPAQGEWGTSPIVGTYRERAYLGDADEFAAMLRGLEGRPDYGDSRARPITTAVLSNADYTLGLITEGADGVRTVHYLNPNVRDRLVFHYHRTREVMS